jgi:hypothetical protein
MTTENAASGPDAVNADYRETGELFRKVAVAPAITSMQAEIKSGP